MYNKSGMWGAGIIFARQMSRLNREISSGTRARGLPSKRPLKSRPKNLIRYNDHEKRFVLSYPSEWEFDPQSGVCAYSKRHGTFVRVDIFESTPELWDEIGTVIRDIGSLNIRKRWDGPPEHVRGDLEIGEQFFCWDAYAHRREGEAIVLSTGNVVDRKRSALVERWEDGTLDAIRRYFVVT